MYATRDDMVRQFGETECIALSDRDYTGEIDDDVLNGGLERATATIDSYLAGRYPVPWTDTPGILTGKCCDIARYELTGAQTQNTEEIRQRYEDAIRYLERVADGRITLGRLPDGSVAQGGVFPAFPRLAGSSGAIKRAEVHFDYHANRIRHYRQAHPGSANWSARCVPTVANSMENLLRWFASCRGYGSPLAVFRVQSC